METLPYFHNRSMRSVSMEIWNRFHIRGNSTRISGRANPFEQRISCEKDCAGASGTGDVFPAAHSDPGVMICWCALCSPGAPTSGAGRMRVSRSLPHTGGLSRDLSYFVFEVDRGLAVRTGKAAINELGLICDCSSMAPAKTIWYSGASQPGENPLDRTLAFTR